MKKLLLSFAFAGAAFTAARAQLAIGDTAPDWTLTDINGNTQNLYSYLDSGYTVLIDVSAAWCGPCWEAHQSGFMKALDEQYGPNGTVQSGKVKVFFIEGESTNTTDQLHGIGTNPPADYATGTQGDWITGEPYTFIDDASVNSQYLDGGFPTFTIICPSRKVSFMMAGYGSMMAQTSYWLPYIDACPVAVSGINAGITGSATPASICSGAPTDLKASLMNLGSVPLTAATVTAKVGGNVVGTANWTGSLNTYDEAEVDLGSYAFDNTADVDYEVTLSGDVNAADNVFTQSAQAVKGNYKTWNLDVTTDFYPGDITWKIMDQSGNVVQEHTYEAGTDDQFGGGGPDAEKSFHYTLNLDANTCYTLQVMDSYGDGMEAYHQGAPTPGIVLKDGDNSTTLIDLGNDFDSGTSSVATTGEVTGINEIISVKDVQIYPNPVRDQLTVNLNLVKKASVSFSIVNVLGQQIGMPEVKQFGSGMNTAALNTSSLAPGVYFLSIQTEEGAIQQKFVKK